MKNKFTIFNKAKYARSEYKVVVERVLKVGFYLLVDFNANSAINLLKGEKSRLKETIQSIRRELLK